MVKSVATDLCNRKLVGRSFFFCDGNGSTRLLATHSTPREYELITSHKFIITGVCAGFVNIRFKIAGVVKEFYGKLLCSFNSDT